MVAGADSFAREVASSAPGIVPLSACPPSLFGRHIHAAGHGLEDTNFPFGLATVPLMGAKLFSLPIVWDRGVLPDLTGAVVVASAWQPRRGRKVGLEESPTHRRTLHRDGFVRESSRRTCRLDMLASRPNYSTQVIEDLPVMGTGTVLSFIAAIGR